jgi:hypothetical protein
MLLREWARANGVRPVIASNLFTFAIAIFAIWLNMAIAKAIVGVWLDDEKATLAAFAFSLGTLAGLRALPFHDDTMFGGLAGVVLAYLGLWWVHFGRPRREAARG